MIACISGQCRDAYESIFIAKLNRQQGPVVSIDSPEAQELAMDMAGREDVVVMIADDWRVIPAENLIARFQPTKTQLIVVVSTVDEAEVMLTTLEIGVDGIILRTGDPNQAAGLRRLVSGSNLKEELMELTVESIRPIGVGDRVCVDTCSLLGTDEGLLVGGSSQGLALVLSEAAESNYVPSRPFRVNAGAVSLYCTVPDGRTKYLSELRAGDVVLAVKADGSTRPVVVARSKIEQRPLLLFTYSCQDVNSPPAVAQAKRLFSSVIQNAETVRVATRTSPPYGLPITTLKPGDKILGRTDDRARHVGMQIEEFLLET